MWKTIEEFDYDWCNDNCGFQAKLELQTRDGEARLRWTCEANVMGHIVLPLLSYVKTTVSGLEQLPYKVVADLMEGEGYGGDLRDIAHAIDAKYDGKYDTRTSGRRCELEESQKTQ